MMTANWKRIRFIMNNFNNMISNNNDNKLVLFDLDGTLVRGRYSVALKSIPAAIEKVFGIKLKFNISKFDGSTDKKAIIDLLAGKGVDKNEVEDNINQLIEARVDYFLTHLDEDYKNRVIESGLNLAKFLKKKNFNIGLLTGNFSKMAAAKLKLIGADNIFDFGLFGEMADNRNKLAQMVFSKAKDRFNKNFSAENIYVIGDTPGDIKCGKSAGVKTIGVATGAFTVSELEKYNPDLAVISLADKRVLNFILKN
jgi:phosphoglycolate phosphatase